LSNQSQVRLNKGALHGSSVGCLLSERIVGDQSPILQTADFPIIDHAATD
jgi:hypothetical protein